VNVVRPGLLNRRFRVAGDARRRVLLHADVLALDDGIAQIGRGAGCRREVDLHAIETVIEELGRQIGLRHEALNGGGLLGES